ncbi:MAG: asparagine synthase B [Bacteroidota bacterium]
MCGIAVISGREDEQMLRRMMETIRHRGPDDSGTFLADGVSLGHVRLSIIDVKTGRQPIYGASGDRCIVYNGEVYNFQELRKTLEGKYRFSSSTDTEVLLHLYEELGREFIHHLDGMFAFAIYDGGELFLARDRLGIKPLYYGELDEGQLAFASETKALTECQNIREFPPGHFYTAADGFVPYYRLPRRNPMDRSTDEILRLLREKVSEAVRKRLVADVPVGVFLSGGLDSSVIAAVMKSHIPDLHSFSVGVEDSPDILASREVAAHLGTRHHEYIYDEEEMKEILPRVIYFLESFDMPLVRSAIPGYFVSRLARGFVKVILTGEGSDELFSGYHHLKKFDDPEELSRELYEITSRLHNTNLQRTDRMSMAHGIEARVPFLDAGFIDFVSTLPMDTIRAEDGRMEKWLLRKAFESDLPEHIVWRRKQKFSEGAGSVDFLAVVADAQIPDEEYTAAKAAASLPLRSKEELIYYRAYTEQFGEPSTPELVGRTLRY